MIKLENNSLVNKEKEQQIYYKLICTEEEK